MLNSLILSHSLDRLSSSKGLKSVVTLNLLLVNRLHVLFKQLNVLDLQCVSCKITLLFSIKDAIKLFHWFLFVFEAHKKYIVIKEKPRPQNLLLLHTSDI